jgi:hypothetical protein
LQKSASPHRRQKGTGSKVFGFQNTLRFFIVTGRQTEVHCTFTTDSIPNRMVFFLNVIIIIQFNSVQFLFIFVQT